jgi:hypothetical protein
VGDTERRFFDRGGAEIDRQDAWFGVVPPPADAAWDWDLAPLGEISRDYSVRNRVVAIRKLRAAAQIA